MSEKLIKVTIRQTDTPPYSLLQLADPSEEAIKKYINQSLVFSAIYNDSVCGVIVLYPHNKQIIEIKNIAVLDSLQRKGIGSQLIDFTIEEAKKLGYKSIEIGTGNSSFGQLYLYQKKGFRITKVIRDFFVDNYSESIIENGLECKDMIVLSRRL
jgi:ribosomal protein S18 acetylase RimI-like enzyme